MQKNKKNIILIVSFIIVCITLAIFLNKFKKIKEEEEYVERQKQRVQTYSKVQDFNSIEEVLLYLDTEFVSKEASNIEDFEWTIKIKSKYNLNMDSEGYYDKLIQYLSYTLNYTNFYIIDEEQNIQIAVIGNEENTTVSKYYINGDEFYFETLKTKKNIENAKEITYTNINNVSQFLTNIINSNWSIANINIGTKESIYNNYDIYFDEGYSIKKVSGKVFNIVFNNRFNDYVIENIKVGTDKATIINTLGEPTFKYNDIIGYKSEYFYIFFNNNEISIYPTVTYNTESIIQVVEKYKDSNDLVSYINEIKSIWNDYDIYDYDSNYVILQYTLKGIKFKYDNTEQNGIILYNNYTGNVTATESLKEAISANDSLPSKMYYDDEDLVFNYEIDRFNENNFYINISNFTSEQIKNISNKYKAIIKPKTNEVIFINLKNEYPNSTLREQISYGIWLDDNIFIYSLNNKGIFKYNAQTLEYSTILNGSEEYKLDKIENNILYYNDKTIEIK